MNLPIFPQTKNHPSGYETHAASSFLIV